MIKKLFALVVILTLLLFSLYGCYDAFSIEQYAYVIAIGIDEGEKNAIKLTMQFAISDSSGQGSSQSDKSSVITVECPSLDLGISIVNSYISKILTLSHCQVIAISEEVASKGIEKYIDTLVNNIEVRPDCNLLITKCDAEEYLKNAEPILTSLTARYYEVLLNSEAYTGYTVKTPILNLSSASHHAFSQYVAILAGLNLEDKDENDYTNTENRSLLEKGSMLKPSETPITGNTVSQVMGLAVLDKMKLVGELNSLESICYLILKNQLDRCTISIPSPFDNNEIIDLVLKLNNSSIYTVNIVNNTPMIKCNVDLNCTIQSYPGNVDYSNEENIQMIEEYASSYMKSKLTDFAYKTAKEFHTDIVGFGYQTSTMYPTITEWENSDWGNNYKNAFFDISVTTTINRTALFSVH